MTRERIEDFREIVLPFVKKRLLETNYENLGESDAEMFAKDFDEILNLAIKALEQEPTIKNDLAVDCISRADVLKLMQDNWHTHNGDWAMQESMDDIRVLPSVTPQEPRKGHWISTETKGVRYAFWCRYKCSLCGGLSDRTNFCPNCGARMVEPQESEG